MNLYEQARKTAKAAANDYAEDPQLAQWFEDIAIYCSDRISGSNLWNNAYTVHHLPTVSIAHNRHDLV